MTAFDAIENIRRALFQRRLRFAAAWMGITLLHLAALAFFAWSIYPPACAPILAAGVLTIIAFAINKRLFRAGTPREAAQFLDETLGAKERFVSLLELQSDGAGNDKCSFLASQAEALLKSPIETITIPPLTSKARARAFAFLPLSVLVALYAGWRVYSRPVFNEAEVAAIEQVLAAPQELPAEVRQSLETLKDTLAEHPLVDAPVSVALAEADAQVRDALGALKEGSASSEAKFIDEQQDAAKPSAAAAPTTTPTATPTEASAQESQKSESKKQEKQKDASQEQSKEGEGSGKKQQDSGKGEGEGQQASQSAQQQNGQQGQGQGQGQGEGQDQGEGKGEGKGEAKEQGTGQGKGQSEGQTNKQGEGQGKGDGAQQQPGEGQGKQEQNGQGAGLNAAKDALDQIKKAQEQQQQEGQQGASSDQKPQGAQGNKPEGGKQGQGASKDKENAQERGDTTPQSSKPDKENREQGGREGGKEGGEEGKKESEQLSKGSQGGKSALPNPGEKGSTPAPGLPPGTSPQERRRAQNVDVPPSDENPDSRFAGKDGETVENKKGAVPKTGFADVQLAKPEVKKGQEEQYIPQEYENILSH